MKEENMNNVNQPPAAGEAAQEIPTPRTDAEAGFILDANEEYAQTFDRCDGGDYVRSDFARTLERETIAQAQRIAELETALTVLYGRIVAGVSVHAPFDGNGSAFTFAERALLNRQSVNW